MESNHLSLKVNPPNKQRGSLDVFNSSVHDLKASIEREIQLIPEDGVTDEHGNWSSHEQEVNRLENLLRDIVYYMREYS